VNIPLLLFLQVHMFAVLRAQMRVCSDHLTTAHSAGTHISSPAAGALPTLIQQQQQQQQHFLLEGPLLCQPHLVSISAAAPSSTINSSSSSSVSYVASYSSRAPYNSGSISATPAAVLIAPTAPVPTFRGGVTDAVIYHLPSSPVAAAAASGQLGVFAVQFDAAINMSSYVMEPGAATGLQDGPMQQQQQQVCYMPMLHVCQFSKRIDLVQVV
jgi:hypothetical protein